MKVVVLGTRGIPDVQGGVETHCRELYPRLCRLGCDVTLFTRSRYVKQQRGHFEGVALKHLFAPESKSLEAITHSLLGILRARTLNPDVLHIHAVGPSIVTPLARLLGMKVVVTNHGPDYARQKWGRIASSVLRLGERLGTSYANRVIAISEHIRRGLHSRYARSDCFLIHNGVVPRKRSSENTFLDHLGVEAGKYILGAGRFVEEKRFHDLIDAFQLADLSDCKLVVAGDADHETAYSRALKSQARQAGVILTGFITGQELDQVFSHASAFVLPSSHEGLPIALLEAMAYGLPILASDIPANVEIGLPDTCYFRLGFVDELARKLAGLAEAQPDCDYEEMILRNYNWDTIARDTLAVYRSLDHRSR